MGVSELRSHGVCILPVSNCSFKGLLLYFLVSSRALGGSPVERQLGQ